MLPKVCSLHTFACFFVHFFFFREKKKEQPTFLCVFLSKRRFHPHGQLSPEKKKKLFPLRKQKETKQK